MAFKVGKTYSRRKISNVLRGSIRSYLPSRKGKIVCGCFKPIPRYNLGAPEEVTTGGNPTDDALLLSKQGDPIPVFLFRRHGAWEYVGLYRLGGWSTDSKLLKQKMRENPARGPIGGVLYFERVSR